MAKILLQESLCIICPVANRSKIKILPSVTHFIFMIHDLQEDVPQVLRKFNVTLLPWRDDLVI
jgi:hypothetical protein